jgi:hypothetical protein
MTKASHKLVHSRDWRTPLQSYPYSVARVSTQCRFVCRLKSLSLLTCVGVSGEACHRGVVP